jgi:uncharacterized membrane protein YtjA (UPF0391 family)
VRREIPESTVVARLLLFPFLSRRVAPISHASQKRVSGGVLMLSWAIMFLVVALIAGILGFGFIAGTAAVIAKVLFVIFLVLFLVSFIQGRRVPL